MFRGDRAKQLRNLHNYTHQEFADLLGVGYAQIYRYESGKVDPPSDVVNRMAEIFQVSADYLLDRSDDPIPNIIELSEAERQAIAYWRQGDRYRAIEIIVAAK